MPDYGHPLLFGTFIGPVHSPPDQPVGLALLSERLGYDLVTFQDHPYQSSYLDTWTLMSWVAARTERIAVSGNVLNLPLRPLPAVLARAVASLDLLSNGRVRLGLGAGYFWDAIEGVGGRRLTPLQAVAALEEAIDIIRETWNADTPGTFDSGGEFYPVARAERGPAPAHRVPIWVGAHKPGMQRLVGRKADGWLPSLPVVGPSEIAKGTAVIDAAAEEAGRDPGVITRLLNVLPDQETPEQLAEMTLQNGFSVFIVLSDDRDALQRFATETAPAIRAHVDLSRA